MINNEYVKRYCCEDVSLIENYDKAIADTTQVWHIHHRLELVKTGAVVDSSKQDLIDWGIYYNRPADELIFLTAVDHYGLHLKGRKHSKEHHRKKSEVQMGEKNSFYGKHHTEEARRKMSEASKRYWARRKGLIE